MVQSTKLNFTIRVFKFGAARVLFCDTLQRSESCLCQHLEIKDVSRCQLPHCICTRGFLLIDGLGNDHELVHTQSNVSISG